MKRRASLALASSPPLRSGYGPSLAFGSLRASLALALMFAGCGGCEETEGLSPLLLAIEVEPPSIDFGEVPVGVRVQGAVTVRSRGDGMLTLGGASLDTPSIFALLNQPAPALHPLQSDVILVEATPREVGVFDAALIVRSDDPEAREVRVPIRLTGVPPPPCDDGNACTEDWFDEGRSLCQHQFRDGIPCTPADRCVVNAVCSEGVCLGSPKSCDDGSPCTKDLCRQTDGECIFLEDEGACDDESPCTIDSCLSDGCSHDFLPSGTPCDDGDLCTEGDACFAGACTGSGVPDGSPCDDQSSCTTGDTCSGGACRGSNLLEGAREGEIVFEYPLTEWTRAFLHRREVSLSEDGVFYGLDHLSLDDPGGLTHVVFGLEQCGTTTYEFAYRPADTHVLVRFVRRAMQIGADDQVRMVVGIRQLPENGYRPETTTYLLDRHGGVLYSSIQTLGGETGRSLLPDGSQIYGVVWPLTEGAPAIDRPAEQNLVVVREDASGRVLWRHERASSDWAEFLGVAGPRVLFWAAGRFGALDFNTGATVWSAETPFVAKEMALSTDLDLGVIRTDTQLIGVEILTGAQVFMFPEVPGFGYIPRTDPVIASDGRILVMMQRASEDLTRFDGLDWVELSPRGEILAQTPLPYTFPDDWGATRHEDHDDPYPTVADDGVAYVGYGDSFWAIDPGGNIRWSLTSTEESAFTGTVPLLRDDGVLLISEESRRIIGVRTNGGRMSASGWASFRHDGARTNFTP